MYSKSVIFVGRVIRCCDCAGSWSLKQTCNYGCGMYRDVHNMLGIFKVYMWNVMHVLCYTVLSMSSNNTYCAVALWSSWFYDIIAVCFWLLSSL